MQSKLEEIINKTKADLICRTTSTRSFRQAIENPKRESLAIIAEIKLSSPAQPFLGKETEIVNRVQNYQDAGVDAVSVITEKHFFGGDPSFVSKIKNAVSLPVLQKDFIIEPYQLYEAKIAGADAILLIAKILSTKDLILFVNTAQKLGLEPIVEINNESELKKATATNTKIIAVNARNLDTFVINIDHACNLIRKTPEKFIKLGFSGISSREDIQKYKKAGTNGILIGTSLMKTKDIKKYLSSLLSVQVKICGIRTLAAAKTAINAGAEFLGFNFIPTSPRYISPKKAKEIIQYIKGKTKIVGIFQNNGISQVNKTAKNLELDFVQLHGNENNEYINKIKFPVIKSIKINSKIAKMNSVYMLLDRNKQGEGETPDLKKAENLAAKFPIFYAGGLTPDNVAEIVRKIQPFAVDVAGGIETDGVQDIKKIKQFIKNAKEAETQI
ncbi:hypothetical protein HYT74_00170 [Candidatus Daviesbacteria bacterium]|nr:hypothetical protein [Candidatus Daviesbacteria bacterium]